MKEFGKLKREEKLALFEAWIDGHTIEMKTKTEQWLENPYPSWVNDLAYRLRPNKPSVNWDHVHPQFEYMATDENGDTFLYMGEPADGDSNWFDNGTKYVHASSHVSFIPGNCLWRESKTRRPT